MVHASNILINSNAVKGIIDFIKDDDKIESKATGIISNYKLVFNAVRFRIHPYIMGFLTFCTKEFSDRQKE